MAAACQHYTQFCKLLTPEAGDFAELCRPALHWRASSALWLQVNLQAEGPQAQGRLLVSAEGGHIVSRSVPLLEQTTHTLNLEQVGLHAIPSCN